MLRVLDVIDKPLSPIPLAPVVVPQNVSTLLFDLSKDPWNKEEIVYVEIFNSGNQNLYYNLGGDCDNKTNYNAWIVPGNMLEVRYCGPVYGYCTNAAGTTASFTIIKRAKALGNFS